LGTATRGEARVMTKKHTGREERIARKWLRRELEHSAYWPRLAETVSDVPDDLLMVWAELADGFDDDALKNWSACMNSPDLYEARIRYLGKSDDTAAVLLRHYVSVMTCGVLPEEVS
jgi:hypothetical protein